MSFSRSIIQWYDKNKRDLPWRHTHNPYVIWLSEVILQQTRVDQGLPYFYRFLDRYPTVKDFASASEDDILLLWQGLGYYSRGRNMLKTARQVMDEYAGIFPVKYNELIRLKGIGSYTAAAISSFAANEPHAVVDGNVYRVLARYFGVEWPSSAQKGKKEVAVLADEILDKKNAGIHNQAMIEFGALLCKPRKPDCHLCPVSAQCFALTHGKVNVLPAKKEKKKLRDRYFNLIVITDGKEILINRRDNTDIWAGLHQPVLIETETEVDIAFLVNLPDMTMAGNEDFTLKNRLRPIVHLLTHQRIHLYAYVFVLKRLPAKTGNNFHVAVNELKNFAFPQPVLRILEIIFNL